jgi:transposase
MSKPYRDWQVDQNLLFPPSVRDFVSPDHLVMFVLSLVREQLDLAAIYAGYPSDKGQPPYDPTMMTVLVLYSYAVGVYSSRRIARACAERVDFMAIVALDPPDFRTISEFRRRHLAALSALFGQVLLLCAAAGLVKLGHVALDGTKIKANASRHKAMSYGRMAERERVLQAEVERWFAAAEAADAEEDRLYGADKRGDELPDWVADKARRLAKIREAKASLEAEAHAAAAAEAGAQAAAVARRAAEGRQRPGRAPAPPDPTPDRKAQKNFTDPDSKLLLSKDGFIQGYNAQAAVDGERQIIVAQTLTAGQSDHGQLPVLLDGIEDNLGRRPREVSADAGYCSEANLSAIAARGIAGYVAVGRAKHPARGQRRRPLTVAMQDKLKRGGRRSRYRLRKQIVEPVFGQIKQARGFRQFLLRGIDQVKAEWSMLCTAHNLLKLAKAHG